ncbi:protein-glutamate methylesterase/protein-glutamine glutaminase [Clostridium sp.]|uniref:protein-glutamate methylesterase/protein-glutamine glutaminase n=1 Tax=Clostridium sp. TaxID=1506 RepID=UPI003D6CFD7A
MRKIISDMVNSETEMEVIDTAKNGEELLSKITLEKPDIITLDVEMPKMDGIETLGQLKKNNVDIPVIMLSSISKTGTELTMECLQLGAFDFIAKPSGAISLDINKVKDELVQKIKLAFTRSMAENKMKVKKNIELSINNSQKVAVHTKNLGACGIEAIVIGASTGGPKALYKVITELPKDLGVPVLVVQHMPAGFTKAFAQRLNLNSEIMVVEAQDGDILEKNVVYIAPGGFHMEVGTDKKIHLNTEPTLWGVRPAADKLFLSATKVYGPRLLSVILTGMGRDGANGTEVIKDNGGITIAEHKSTCIIYGMPKAAFETGKVDEVIPLSDIAERISKILVGR